ncbi:hypothetical protein [uncultured Paracoccus sp.]|uniref:hypothetical protein n=1 Tax=uncultured Paracoccus sp. TaxID=189685 RepID=UPI00262667FF|nr:hypothetical protein [uncultured Paracoccus sp.]
MFDGHTHHETTDILARRQRDAVRHRIRSQERGHGPDAIDLWRAPLHLGFTFGLIMAKQVMGVR